MSKQMVAMLTAEHLVALQKVDQIREDLEKLRNQSNMADVQSSLMDFCQFMGHKIDQHFAQEEDALFPKLVKKGMQSEVDKMLEEHKIIQEAHQVFLNELHSSNPQPQAIIENGSLIADRLEQHIQREHGALAKI